MICKKCKENKEPVDFLNTEGEEVKESGTCAECLQDKKKVYISSHINVDGFIEKLSKKKSAMLEALSIDRIKRLNLKQCSEAYEEILLKFYRRTEFYKV